jgi:hypothetical protein
MIFNCKTNLNQLACPSNLENLALVFGLCYQINLGRSKGNDLLKFDLCLLRIVKSQYNQRTRIFVNREISASPSFAIRPLIHSSPLLSFEYLLAK